MHELNLATCHPVDALKYFARPLGITMPPEFEAELRAICDAPTTLAEQAAPD